MTNKQLLNAIINSDNEELNEMVNEYVCIGRRERRIDLRTEEGKWAMSIIRDRAIEIGFINK